MQTSPNAKEQADFNKCHIEWRKQPQQGPRNFNSSAPVVIKEEKRIPNTQNEMS
jgi:hypothetical protein